MGTIEFCGFLVIEDASASISYCKYKSRPGAYSADDLPRLGDEEAGVGLVLLIPESRSTLLCSVECHLLCLH